MTNDGKDTTVKKVEYATFSGRMIASVIDSLLSAVLLVPIFGILYGFIGISKPDSLVAPLGTLSTEELMQIIAESAPSFLFENAIVAVIVIILWIYKSATPGKMVMKMKIVDAKTNEKPKKLQSVIRYLGYFVSIAPLGLGFIWIYYDKRRQGFHDKIAGTVVIKYD